MTEDKLSLSEQIKIAHEQIRHEDGLVNHRLSWLLTIQGLLFASIGIMIK
ncbi:hypothetical protein [Bosea sp. R86505]